MFDASGKSEQPGSSIKADVHPIHQHTGTGKADGRHNGTATRHMDIVTVLATSFLKQYPTSTNGDVWDHVVFIGRSHPLFLKAIQKFVTFQPKKNAAPITLNRHQFAKRMHHIRLRVWRAEKLDEIQTSATNAATMGTESLCRGLYG